jgi:hypothetical protein
MKPATFSDFTSKHHLRLTISTYEGSCSYPNDHVEDTVPQKESSSSFKMCSKTKHKARKSCKVSHFDPTGKMIFKLHGDDDTTKTDDYRNVMDYASDDCIQRFTPGQILRLMYVWQEVYHGH